MEMAKRWGALSAWVAESTRSGDKRIVVSPDKVEQLAARFSRTWMRPPTEFELTGLVAKHPSILIFYRGGW